MGVIEKLQNLNFGVEYPFNIQTISSAKGTSHHSKPQNGWESVSCNLHWAVEETPENKISPDT